MSLHPKLAATAGEIERMASDDRPALNRAITGWARVTAERKRSSAQRLLAATCEQAGRVALAGGDVQAIFAGAASALGYPSDAPAVTRAKPKRHRSPGGRWNG